jgi:hypothetical protein
MIGPEPRDHSVVTASDRTLRQFAGLCVLICGGLFAFNFDRTGGSPRVADWLVLALGLVTGVPGLFRVGWVRPVFLLLNAITRPIGHVTGKLMLALLYFGFLTPLALLMRAAGYEPFDRVNPGASSYWSPIAHPSDVLRYIHQYQDERTRSHLPTGVCDGSPDIAR